MRSESFDIALRKVRDSSDEELEGWWSGLCDEEFGAQLVEGIGMLDWRSFVVSELIYRGFCFQVIEGKECADRGVPVTEMCPGCETYWVKAARLACRTTDAWIAECSR